MKENILNKELKVNFDYCKEGYKSLEEFPIEETELPLEIKVPLMLEMLENCYLRTKKELSGLFNLKEALFIVAVLNSHLYNSNISDKSVLISQIEGSIIYEGIDTMMGIDGEKVLEKIKGLTEFQCFTIIKQAREVTQKNNIKSSIPDEKVIDIFGIRDEDVA